MPDHIEQLKSLNDLIALNRILASIQAATKRMEAENLKLRAEVSECRLRIDLLENS